MKRSVYATQGRVLIAELRRKAHTYRDMLSHGVSMSPWKRIAECLRADERLIKGTNTAGLTTWRVVKARSWVA
jgi:hypothetical protein